MAVPRRLTIRLPDDLYAQLVELGYTGRAMSDIVRRAVSEHLARRRTPALAPEDVQQQLADLTAAVQHLQTQVQHLTEQLAVLTAPRADRPPPAPEGAGGRGAV